MLQDLKWDTFETVRRHTGLSDIYKMCDDFIGGGMEGLFDSKWRKENTRKPRFLFYCTERTQGYIKIFILSQGNN